MGKIDLKNLTPRQLVAWRMRYQFGWRMKKIALKMGMTQPSVSRLIARAHVSAGLPPCRVRMIRTKPREVSAYAMTRIARGILMPAARAAD